MELPALPVKPAGVLPAPWGFKVFPPAPESPGARTQKLLGLGGAAARAAQRRCWAGMPAWVLPKKQMVGWAKPWCLGSSPPKRSSVGVPPAQSTPQPCSLSLVPPSVDVGKSPHVPYVYVGHHGEVQNLKPIQVMTACSLDIYNFPFDVQNCSLTFTSWLHHSECRDPPRPRRTRGERAGPPPGWSSVQKATCPSRWPQRIGDACGEGRHPARRGGAGSCRRFGPGTPGPHLSSAPQVRDINLSLWRQPELVKFDRSVFMNQGEWELLYVLSRFQEFSVKSSDSYAEMKFYVRAFGDGALGNGFATVPVAPSPGCSVPQCSCLWAGGSLC